MHAPTPIRVILASNQQIFLWGIEKLLNETSPVIKVVGKTTSAADTLQMVTAACPDVLLLDLHRDSEKNIAFIPAIVEVGHTRVMIFVDLDEPPDTIDRAVLNGASGVMYRGDPVQDISKAIEIIHHGELWLKRAITSRLLIKSLHAGGEDSIRPDSGRIATLTRRELSIVNAFAVEIGASNKKIAEKLHISEQTLRNYLTPIFSKLGIENRFDLFVFARLQQQRNPAPPPAATITNRH